MSEPDLQKLLETKIQEEHYFLEAHQKRIAFYFSVVTAILAATVAGAINASSPEHYLLLLPGPLLVLALAKIARFGTFRFYQRFLETVTMRAKLEQALGLTRPHTIRNEEADYWPEEALIPGRHIRSRKACESSDAFIEKHGNLGYQKATHSLLSVVQVIAVCLLLGLVTIWLHRAFHIFDSMW
jgi:hypothetical protein